MTTLESIYYGENPPCEQTYLCNPEYQNLQHQYNQLQQSLLSQLKGESLEIFKQLESLSLQIQSLIEKDSWVEGFKTGVRVMVESLGQQSNIK